MNSPMSRFRELGDYLGNNWNQFWFQPTGVRDLCKLRIAVGALALIWQLSFTVDLVRWFAPDGWIDLGLYHSWVVEDLGAGVENTPPGFVGRLSYLFNQSPAVLLTLHFFGTAVLVAFTVGLGGRISAVLAWFVLLSYVHRAPFLGGAVEPVLTMLVGYLCIAPIGVYNALKLRKRTEDQPDSRTYFATIARRLIQVHLTVIYLVMFTTKLVSPAWWNGEALWWISAQQLIQTIDLTFVRAHPQWLNLWTFGVLISEFAMCTLVWNRTLRPFVVAVSMISWMSVALASGQAALSLTMIIANLSFLAPEAGEETVTNNTDVDRAGSASSEPHHAMGETSHVT